MGDPGGGPARRISLLDGYPRSTWGVALPPLYRRAPRQRVEPHAACARAPPPHQRAELYRRVNADGAPDSWGLRLLNGHDERSSRCSCRTLSWATTTSTCPRPTGLASPSGITSRRVPRAPAGPVRPDGHALHPRMSCEPEPAGRHCFRAARAALSAGALLPSVYFRARPPGRLDRTGSSGSSSPTACGGSPRGSGW